MHVDIHLVHKHALVYVMIVRDYIVVWCVAIVFLIITIWRKQPQCPFSFGFVIWLHAVLTHVFIDDDIFI